MIVCAQAGDHNQANHHLLLSKNALFADYMTFSLFSLQQDLRAAAHEWILLQNWKCAQNWILWVFYHHSIQQYSKISCKVHPKKSLRCTNHCACPLYIPIWATSAQWNSILKLKRNHHKRNKMQEKKIRIKRKHPQMKQTNRFTWKELSMRKSQKYKVDENCRQNERITPFIHFFSSFSSCFAQSFRLLYILPSGP